MKVKVTKSSDEFWYSDYIGEIIEVVECYDYDSDDHRVVDWQRYDDEPDTVGLFIRRQDCEIVSKTCEEVTMAQAKEETKEFKVGDEVKVVRDLNFEKWGTDRPSTGTKGVVDHLHLLPSASGYSKPMVGVYIYGDTDWDYEPDELELAEPKEAVLTKEEALKAAIDGAVVVNEHCKNRMSRIYWNGKIFILVFGFDGREVMADDILDAKRWKLWTPPTPKPKFSIDQFVLYEESYYKIIDTEYKHGSHRYFISPGIYRNTKEDCTIADEFELSEVKQ